jgi:type I restriction enzyme, S subunit
MQNLVKFKKTKIGEVPEGWKYEKISENSILKGRIGWQGLTTAEYLKKGTFYLVTGTDFKDGKIDWKNCVYVDKERYIQDENIQLKRNDVLVTKDGTIGKIAYIDTLPQPATLNSGIFVIRPINSAYFPLFLYYILCSNYFLKFLNKLKAGSTISHLYQKDFVNFNFPIPPLKEQQKITSILSNVDELIQKIEQLIKQTQRLKKGLMQRLLTKGIGHLKFRTIHFQPRVLKQQVPIDWEVDKLENLLLKKPQNGITKLSSSYGSGYPIAEIDTLYQSELTLLQNNLRKVPLTLNELDNYRLTNNDFLINRVSKVKSGAGKLVLVKEPIKNLVYEGNLIRFKINEEKIIPEFFEYFSKSSLYYNYMQSVCKTLSLTSIDQDIINKVPILIPSTKQEQKQILKVISSFDLKIINLRNNNFYLKKLKKGLMQKLLTGQIRVKV